MTSSPRRVLVVGGGPAGATTAYWLAKGGFHVTVAERSTTKFAYGQGIDITGPAVEVIKHMGLYDQIKANTTGEAGLTMVNDESAEIATIGTAPEDNSTAALTQEIEIMRGTLTEILANAAKALPNVTYRYGCTISDMQQSERGVTAVLSDSQEPEDFVAIVGADGQKSRVRSLLVDSDTNNKCIDAKDVYVGFFSMPGDPEQDLPNSRMQNATGGRQILIRPSKKDGSRSSCYMAAVGDYPRLRDLAEHGQNAEQKTELLRIFDDLSGLGKRARDALQTGAEDFYFTRVVQVKLDSWHDGRCALVGDAAYCPSPLTGQGTTLALLGAYVLAGEMACNPNDPTAAFRAYEKTLEAYVKREQQIPLGGRAPELLNPQSKIGVSVARTLFSIVAKSGLWKMIDIGKDETFILPEYRFDGANAS